MSMGSYLRVREQMRTGDIIEWRSNSFIGWAIRAKTGKAVNHTSLVLDLPMFDGKRKFILEALGHGVVLSLLSRRLQHHDGSAYWMPLRSNYDPYRERIGKWALEQVGTKYDYPGIFKALFGRVSEDMHKLFCSEYAYFAYKAAGIYLKYKYGAPYPGEMEALDIFLAAMKTMIKGEGKIE